MQPDDVCRFANLSFPVGSCLPSPPPQAVISHTNLYQPIKWGRVEGPPNFSEMFAFSTSKHHKNAIISSRSLQTSGGRLWWIYTVVGVVAGRLVVQDRQEGLPTLQTKRLEKLKLSLLEQCGLRWPRGLFVIGLELSPNMTSARAVLGLAAALALVQITTSSSYCKDLRPVIWTGGSFRWPCPSTKTIFKNSGQYVSKNIIGIRAQIFQDMAFVALPRFKPGNPVTLAILDLNSKSCQAELVPFPCWSMQEEGNCRSLQSVVDLHLDAQDILWVLDVGIVNILESPVRRCSPKVVAFSAKTGKVLKIIDLSGLVCEISRLQYLVVDYSADGQCFLYISDAAARAILVYDLAEGRGYRVVLPKAVTLGCSKRDVLSLALVRRRCGNTYLYFTYLSSPRLFAIKTQFLRKGATSGRVVDLGPKPGKIVIIGTDNGAAIFFRFEGQGDIYRWDTNKCFRRENFIIVHRSLSCYLATHALADYGRGRMVVLESNFHDYVKGTVGCGAVQSLSVMQNC
uniref:Bee-milk protein n=1 Tax=Timema bartmani TaxID=61472 RepID=A0A7R9I0M3_9NEOP|nr:unnamed protein product [Timema bartmani]